jgi:fibronectin type 3 domain-containing protein
VETSDVVSIRGELSAPICVTPVDRYPPPVPTGLRAVQEGGGITLLWEAVDAPDLAGYVVLRADSDGADMMPLTRDLLTATTYRDTTVAAGGTYGYAVLAVDTSPAANASPLSTRQTVAVR